MRTAIILLGVIFTLSVQAQNKQSQEMAYMVVQSHQMCNTCVELIQEEMQFQKGVHKVEVDTETFEIMVDFNPSKTDKDQIRAAIAKLGVDADDLKADPKGAEKLPACCKNNKCGQAKEATKAVPCKKAED